MIVTRIQLYCSNESCQDFYPSEGPVDGAIFTPQQLRGAARKHGWARRVNSRGVLVDVCPSCLAAGYPPEEEAAR